MNKTLYIQSVETADTLTVYIKAYSYSYQIRNFEIGTKGHNVCIDLYTYSVHCAYNYTQILENYKTVG